MSNTPFDPWNQNTYYRPSKFDTMGRPNTPEEQAYYDRAAALAANGYRADGSANPIYAPDRSSFASSFSPQYMSQLGALDASAGNRASPMATAATYDPTLDNADRSMQAAYAGKLEDIASGRGPSIAGEQMQRGLAQSQAQQVAMVGSQAGDVDAGVAMRMMAAQNAQQNQGLVGQQAAARQQEQTMARSQLAGLYGQMQSADMQGALANAGFAQQTNLANQQAQMGMYGLNDEQRRWALAQQRQQAEADRQAKMAYESQRSNAALGSAAEHQQYDADWQARQNAQQDRVERFVAGAGMALATVSDERAKTDIKPADSKLASFLSALGAHSYVYRDKSDGEGRYVSPMAQELAKSEIGASMVFERPDGKMMVDCGRGLGAMLSAAAMHERRIAALEKGGSDPPPIATAVRGRGGAHVRAHALCSRLP